jgi:hypothetical protein
MRMRRDPKMQHLQLPSQRSFENQLLLNGLLHGSHNEPETWDDLEPHIRDERLYKHSLGDLIRNNEYPKAFGPTDWRR